MNYFLFICAILITSCNVLEPLIQNEQAFDEKFFCQENCNLPLIANYNNNLVWFQKFTGETNQTSICYSIKVDSNGDIYCSGHSNGALENNINYGLEDAFITKLDNNGMLQWHSQIGSSGDDRCYDMALDSQRNIYCVGSSNSNFNNASNNHIGGNDGFLIKYNSNGAKVYEKQYGTTSNDEFHKIIIDENDNLYIAGVTLGDFVSGNYTNSKADLIFLKLNTNGDVIWQKQIYDGQSGGYNEYCKGFALDSFKNIYCAGYTNGNFGDISNTISTNNESMNGGNTLSPDNGFIIKLSNTGDLNWKKQFDQQSSERFLSMQISSDNQIYVSGFTTNNALNSQDIILVKYDIEGNQHWIKQFTNNGLNTDSNDAALSLFIDRNKSIYLAGRTASSLTEPTAGGNDIFIMKLHEQNLVWTKHFGMYYQQSQLADSNINLDNDDQCFSVFVDIHGAVYCSGKSNNDFFVLKMD